MEEKTTAVIRDIMVPLDRYPHLNENKTLQDAIGAFKTWPDKLEGFCYSKVLVVNDENQLIGTVSRLDILKGMAPRLFDATKVEKFEGKDAEYPNLIFLFEEKVFAECGENRLRSIKEIVADIDFSLPADTPILKAMVMISNRQDFNVPITDNGNIIGVLRLADIFNALCDTYCVLKEKK